MIVIACGAYNEEAYLPETIPAILAQTYPDFRLLLVDNGSTDGTWDHIARFAKQDHRLFPFRLSKNHGSGEATQEAMFHIRYAWPRAEWVVFHGADDLMDPDYLEALVEAAQENPNANYIFSPWRCYQHPEMEIRVFPPYNPATIATQHQIPNWAMLKMSLWQETGGYDRTINAGADWDWAVRASLMGLLNPYQLKRTYLALRVRENRKSHSDEVDFTRLFAHMAKHRPGQWAIWQQEAA